MNGQPSVSAVSTNPAVVDAPAKNRQSVRGCRPRPEGWLHEGAVRGERFRDRARSGGSARVLRRGAGSVVRGGEDDYVFTEQLTGVKHFGLWPLPEAAKACLERKSGQLTFQCLRPPSSSKCQMWRPLTELKARGYSLIHGAKTEPWTQVTARLLSPDGLLMGVCYTPWFHDPPP